MKNKILIALIWAVTVGSIWLVMAMNPLLSDTDEQIWYINNEITMLERQILDNKVERTIIDNEINNLQSEQKLYETANNDLRDQKEDLKLEKKNLGL